VQKVKVGSAGRRAHLTTRQAAAHCRVSIPTLRRWIRAGDLHAYLTPGGHRRIDLDEFQRFLAAQGRPPYPDGAGARTRLLIVDDEPLVVAMLVDLLSGGPFTVETATDGYEALVKVGTFRPAVIILDAVLPGLDGVEACRCLRRLPETRDIRILGVTGHPSVAPGLRGAGADACVSKPLDPNLVVRELERLAASTRASHSLTEREG
jgi:excisionase family DNA binding protein